MKKQTNDLSKHRRFRYGRLSVLLTVIVIITVILLNVAAGALEKRWGLTVDATALQITDFDERTIDIVSSLKQNVRICTIYSPSTSTALRVQVEDLLSKLRAVNKNITIENIDPALQPDFVKSYADSDSVPEGSIIVFNEDGTRSKFISRNDYYYGYTASYNQQDYAVFNLESKLATAILNVTADSTPAIYFLAGHDELDSLQYAKVLFSTLEEMNYEPAVLNITTDGFLPRKGDALVITDPQTDLSDSEFESIIDWMVQGGRLLINITYRTDLDKLPNYTRLLSYYSLSLGNGYVSENPSASSNWLNETFALVPNMDADHAITKPLVEQNHSTYMPYARPINPVTFPEYGTIYTNLLYTSPSAVTVYNGEEGTPSTQVVGLALQKTDDENEDNETRIVVLTGDRILYDTQMMYNTYNPILLINVFDWLINQNLSVTVPSKILAINTLSLPNASVAWTWATVVVIIMPVIAVITGVVVWLRRRRL